MIRTILGLIFNRSGRKKYADMHADGGILITSDLLNRPVVAPKEGFVEHGDEAFSLVRHDGCGLDTTVYVEGKGKNG